MNFLLFEISISREKEHSEDNNWAVYKYVTTPHVCLTNANYEQNELLRTSSP